MDKMATSSTSTSSVKSSAKSSRSGNTLGEPKPPIDPPRRRSSLGFSQAVQPEVAPSHTQNHAASLPTPPAPVTRTPDVGRKRGCLTPLMRSAATPGHNVNMQKIFQDASAHLQLDIAFASSPCGSIESRLPPGGTPSISQASSRIVSARQKEGPDATKDWRYSTAPGILAQPHLDVREPLPDSEPVLPDLSLAMTERENAAASAEPLSSGFNTPEDHDMQLDDTEIDQMLPPLPDTSPLAGRFPDIGDVDQGSHSSPTQKIPMLTDLERPLQELNVRPTRGEMVDEDVSPAIAYLQQNSPSLELSDVSSISSGEQPIFLSTPAKAAAESARAKRGLQWSGLRSTSDKENIPPAMIYPDPYVHTNLTVTQCPNPRRHFQSGPQASMSTPSTFGGRQSRHSTPNPYIQNQQPSPSPLRASLYLPAPQYRRADSSGSPLPVLKVESSPQSPGPHVVHQRQSYFSTTPNEYAHLPTAIFRPSTARTPAEHFRPGWYHYPPTEMDPPKPKSLTYAFSTAAAKVVGSSPAPDSRIRDSYRTDTLTPLAKPASRYRKNGIGAIAARRLPTTASYSPWPSIAGPGNHRPRTGAPPSRHGMTNPEQHQLMSSPPRQSNYSACMPMMRARPKATSRDFNIAENDRAASLPETPMEIDEDIQAAISMSIGGIPEAVAAVDRLEPIHRLSPNVSPYRGKCPVKRPRTTSYWDHDLPEVRKIDQARMKRPATMEAGTVRVKSMRVSGIRSSPPRIPMASKAPTVGSASIYSQAGLSEMSRPQTRARRGDEAFAAKDGDVEMGEAEKDSDVGGRSEMKAETQALREV